jgi:hypothetical protein
MTSFLEPSLRSIINMFVANIFVVQYIMYIALRFLKAKKLSLKIQVENILSKIVPCHLYWNCLNARHTLSMRVFVCEIKDLKGHSNKTWWR